MFEDVNDDFGPVCEVTIVVTRRAKFGFLEMAKKKPKPRPKRAGDKARDKADMKKLLGKKRKKG